MSLSTALCRPTSSRMAEQAAGRVEKRRGVQSAGLVEDRLRVAQRGGQAVDRRGVEDRPVRAVGGVRWLPTLSAAMDALPHTPQLDVV